MCKKNIITKLYDILVGLDMISYAINDREAIEEYKEIKNDVEECIKLLRGDCMKWNHIGIIKTDKQHTILFETENDGIILHHDIVTPYKDGKPQKILNRYYVKGGNPYRTLDELLSSMV